MRPHPCTTPLIGFNVRVPKIRDTGRFCRNHADSCRVLADTLFGARIYCAECVAFLRGVQPERGVDVLGVAV